MRIKYVCRRNEIKMKIYQMEDGSRLKTRRQVLHFRRKETKRNEFAGSSRIKCTIS